MKAKTEATPERLLSDIQEIMDRGLKAIKGAGDRKSYLVYLRDVHVPLQKRILADRENEVLLLKAG